MFDRYEFRADSQVPQSIHTTVHEHRAPTDASVKLLSELETAAQKKIEQSIRVGDSVFECVIHTQHDHASDQIKVAAIFSLNGKQMTWRKSFNHHDFTPEHAFEKVTEGIAQMIAQECVAKSLASAFFGPKRIVG